MKNHYLNLKSPINDIRLYGNQNTEIQTGSNWHYHSTISSYDDHLDRAGVGFWRFHCKGHKLELCAVSSRMTQLKNLQGIYSVMKQLHQLTSKDFILSIIELAKTGNGFEEEAHLVLTNGESRWFKLTGILEQHFDGRHQVSGTMIDITAFKMEEIRKMDLMAFMSHELKTPLTIMKLYIQSAAKFMNIKSDDFVKEQLDKADAQVASMRKLIDNYLSFSMSMHASGNMQMEWFDFSTLVYETVSHHAEINPDHIFKMEINGSLFVKGDKDKIRQVMNNLITNAVKFSPENCFIKVSCKKKADSIQFSVLDQGNGIAETDQKKLFSKHFRAGNTRTGAIKGHGLGLYLSKEIVELHQGSMFFDSKLGLGSIFGFLIPDLPHQ